jgi:hypothetical protein
MSLKLKAIGLIAGLLSAIFWFLTTAISSGASEFFWEM